MEMFNPLVEAVFMSFLIGAILGGVIVAHIVAQPENQENDDLAAVKIRSDKEDR